MIKSYSEKLRDPRWQKKRLEIMQRDKFTCTMCGDSETTLHVHHHNYSGIEPWEYENHDLKTLCQDCHKSYEKYLKSYGKPEFFETLKIKKHGNNHLFVMTDLGLMMPEGVTQLSQNSLHKVVQFTINTWLKHG